MDFVEELRWRGLIYDMTEGLAEALARAPLTAYIGFDPTAPSLHVGSLLPIMGLARLQRAGHRPVALVGGGTGLIGDPSGKSQERALLSMEDAERNAHGMRRQLERFLEFGAGPTGAIMENNAAWLLPLKALELMREVGKHFTVNYMLAKESVNRRLGGDEGISFTEFSYLLLQSYDYLVLHDRHRCTLQMGGSDQWGNITAGCDLVRKVRGSRVHGLVFPLITTASGTKFGKTEAGTVWLDPDLTSPFKFYQFWLNTDDRDAVRYLKFFTWLDRAPIAALENAVATAPESREAQRTLAREVTAMVHGPGAVEKAERAAGVLYGGSVAGLTVDELLPVLSDVPLSWVSTESLRSGLANTELVVLAGLATSKGEAGRLIKQGGISVNDRRLTDERGRITIDEALERQLFVVRKGRRQTHVVRIGEPPS